FYGSFRFGGWVDYDVESDVWFTAVAGLTKYVLTRGKYRLHGYAGVGTTYEAYEEYTYDTSWTDSYFTIDAGIVNVIGRFNLTLGLEYQIEIGADIVFGVGVVF
ncbi:MAG: hypothetical protein KAT15_04895, partial [Bacteroidales bacterium]|nr:hypothetical protein [Bacteroidales bacterium]